jgi:hypothetical protein
MCAAEITAVFCNKEYMQTRLATSTIPIHFYVLIALSGCAVSIIIASVIVIVICNTTQHNIIAIAVVAT